MIMSKWRYTLKVSSELRMAIADEDIWDVCDALEKAWKEIHEQFPDEYGEFELENDLENICDARETEDEEEVDYLLSELYDYCDNTRIWIEL